MLGFLRHHQPRNKQDIRLNLMALVGTLFVPTYNLLIPLRVGTNNVPTLQKHDFQRSRRTSKRSRKRSPNRFTASTTNANATPGTSTICGATNR